jgi:hypothetical protein
LHYRDKERGERERERERERILWIRGTFAYERTSHQNPKRYQVS